MFDYNFIIFAPQLRFDLNNGDVNCPASATNTSGNSSNSSSGEFEPNFPKPTANGYFEAFAGIMFAFGGASTFPTIQADMADKKMFKWAAVAALGS